MNILKNIGILFGALYLIVASGLYFVQERLLFLPDKLPEDYTFRTGEEVEIEVEDGISLNCLWMKEPAARGVILYLHGNKGTNRRCIRQAQTMSGNQYDIFMPDYRGYGKSDGNIYSEAQLFSDAQKVYDFLKKHYTEEQIVIVGYSIGTGMASYLAAHNNPQQLALVAPYRSIIDMKNRMAPIFPDFLVKYKLRNDDHLAKVKCPVSIFHGTNDEVIPYNAAEQLQQLEPEKVQLITMNGESHRGSIFNQVFRNTISKILL